MPTGRRRGSCAGGVLLCDGQGAGGPSAVILSSVPEHAGVLPGERLQGEGTYPKANTQTLRAGPDGRGATSLDETQ